MAEEVKSPARYTITAALPYTNGPIHIGHLAGVYVPADIYSRYLRLTGKDVVFVFPIDKWILMMIKAGAEIRNLGDVKWLSTEDKLPGKGTGRHIACFILKGKK